MMTSMKMINSFTDRYPLIGPIVWVLSVQYFVIQIIVGLACKAAYTLTLSVTWAILFVAPIQEDMCAPPCII
jgi:hypothetical protein